MKDSFFKKKAVDIRADASFTKKETPVSSFSDENGEQLLKNRAISELRELFSCLGRDGISHEELELELAPRDGRLAVYITRRGKRPLGLNETNLIFRLAIEHGLSPRAVGGGVEILSSLPRLEDSKIYSRILVLLRESLNGKLL